MRPSEYLALKWSDIDWQRGTASVCRSIQFSQSAWQFDVTERKRSRRVIKLRGFVPDALKNVRNTQLPAAEGEPEPEHDLVFHTGAGLPLGQINVKREFRGLLKAASLQPIRLYGLRHNRRDLGSGSRCFCEGHFRSARAREHFVYAGALLSRASEHSGRGCRENRADADGTTHGRHKRMILLSVGSRRNPP